MVRRKLLKRQGSDLNRSFSSVATVLAGTAPGLFLSVYPCRTLSVITGGRSVITGGRSVITLDQAIARCRAVHPEPLPRVRNCSHRLGNQGPGPQ